MENVFIDILKENIDDLRSGNLPKGKFIGKYMEQLNKKNPSEAFRYKHPQILGFGKDVKNNWIDYILGLTDEEFEYFKSALFNH